MSEEKAPPLTRDLLAFLDQAPTPYHAVSELCARLEQSGFRRFDEREPWRIVPETRGYVVRAGGSLIAFVAGLESPTQTGFAIAGAHTDSPNLRLKPKPEFVSSGYAQLAVEVYGGVLFSTWLDRDLSLAGRVVLRDSRVELVRLPEVRLRIANLAIHLNREVNLQGLILNPQIHLIPIAGLEETKGSALLEVLSRKLTATSASGCRPEDILAFDLSLYDAQGASFGGVNQEFIFSARLDNLVSCHAACAALIAASAPRPASRLLVLYDHEEVGSQSSAGARSEFLQTVIERITTCYTRETQALAQACARSLFVSVDMAHAIHPNYSDKHDKQHRPVLGAGPVIKLNANQSYATDGPATAAFVEACRRCEITPQYFVSRNDLPCGSTIGPISAARLGVRTVDVGNPMLSMHSCREMAGSADVTLLIRVLTELYSRFESPNPAA